MLLAVLFYGVTVLGGQVAPQPAPQASPPQSNHQFIHPSPNMAEQTMGRFSDMHQRQFIEEFRREQHEENRRAVIAHRMALADQLDNLIAARDCGQATEIAQRAGYRDIREGVARACRAYETSEIR